MVSVVDVTTGEGYNFYLDSGRDVTVRRFLSDVEEKLSSQQQLGEYVRIASAAVGCAPINICDDKRFLNYYLMEGEPLFIQTEVYNSSYRDVCIHELSSEDRSELTSTYVIPCDLSNENVRHLKVKLAKMTRRQANSFHLYFNRRKLDDGLLLSRCGLEEGNVLECVTVTSSNRLFFGTSYIDIAPFESKLKQLQQIVDRLDVGDKHCPSWRRALPGLWLEGVCTNHICPAYSHMVVMNLGFTNLDFITDKANCRCPICYSTTMPLLCGFSKCKFRTVGRLKPAKTKEVSDGTVVKEDWRIVSESKQYITIFPDTSLWTSFKVIATELLETKFCVACLNTITGESRTVNCGHSFHQSCWRKKNLKCLQCFGSRIVSTY